MKLHETETRAVRSVIARLRELIAALDRRTPRPERTGEQQIVADSEALREEAVERLAELEMRAKKSGCSLASSPAA